MVDLSHEIVSGRLGVDASGTRIDAPFHLHADRADLAHLPLERLVNVSVVVVRAYAQREITVEDLGDPGLLWGKAVLVYTGRSRRWGTPAYLEERPFLTAEAVRVLVGANVALVGIDGIVDDPVGSTRHALLGADIPIVEHMTNLDLIPDTGALFTVLPPPVRGMASVPVRAVAVFAG
jgi:kynurenine formamidase